MNLIDNDGEGGACSIAGGTGRGTGNGGDVTLSAGKGGPQARDGDICFVARGSLGIPLNEEGSVDLVGFEANSLVGGLNELKKAAVESPNLPLPGGISYADQSMRVHVPFDADTIKRVLTLGMVSLAGFGVVVAVCVAVVEMHR